MCARSFAESHMRQNFISTLAIGTAFALSACGGGETPNPNPTESEQATQTRPADDPSLVTVEGRIEEGTECPILRTPDGEVYVLSLGEADFGPGDYVRFTGEEADASFCMEGQATLIPENIEEIDPPARDRDPARSGGIALTEDYLIGSWVAKGVDADCDDPDFTVSKSPGALVMEADISRHDRNAAIALGDYPRLVLDEPMDDLPMEARGPDGVAILRPATDAAYEPVSIGSATIKGDGVVFVKCSD